MRNNASAGLADAPHCCSLARSLLKEMWRPVPGCDSLVDTLGSKQSLRLDTHETPLCRFTELEQEREREARLAEQSTYRARELERARAEQQQQCMALMRQLELQQPTTSNPAPAL